jgi:hypothetical protein
MYAALRKVIQFHRPLGPDQPRPGGRPKYISPKCPVPGCNKDLVLDDELDGVSPESVFHDEWTCPSHREIFIDHPTEQVASA